MLKRVLVLVGVMIAFSFIFIGVWILFGDAIQERVRRIPFDPISWREPSRTK